MLTMEGKAGQPKEESIGKYLLLAGAGCALVLAFIGAAVFFVFSITHSARPEPAKPPVRTDFASSSVPEAPQRETLRIDDVKVQKQLSENATTVSIRFKVSNFASDTSGSEPRIHLIQDLKTYGPDGSLVPDLSADGIKELQQGGLYEYADFSNTLTIPLTDPQGMYRAHLIIHDQIANRNAEATTEFELP